MTFDELQETWQSQQSSFKIKIDSDLLLKEIQRNKKHFEYTVLWRDLREIVAGLAVAIFFLYYGLKSDACAWALLLLAFLCAGVVVFLIADRLVQKKKKPRFGDSLVDCIQSSLANVEHQVWLLKNVLWWYLLPPGIGIVIFVGSVMLKIIQNVRGKGLVDILLFLFAYLVGSFLLFWGVYYLNQWAVRKYLIPRKEELEHLLHGLENSPTVTKAEM